MPVYTKGSTFSGLVFSFVFVISLADTAGTPAPPAAATTAHVASKCRLRTAALCADGPVTLSSWLSPTPEARRLRRTDERGSIFSWR